MANSTHQPPPTHKCSCKLGLPRFDSKHFQFQFRFRFQSQFKLCAHALARWLLVSVSVAVSVSVSVSVAIAVSVCARYVYWCACMRRYLFPALAPVELWRLLARSLLDYFICSVGNQSDGRFIAR